MPDLSNIPYALVVDDDAVILSDAAQIIEDAGFRTLTAMNAEDALQLLRKHADAVTLVFTDVEMPGPMDGFELTREAARQWPDIYFLIASGRREPESNLPPLTTFLRKPFSAEIVRARLQELLPDGAKPDVLKQAVH